MLCWACGAAGPILLGPATCCTPSTGPDASGAYHLALRHGAHPSETPSRTASGGLPSDGALSRNGRFGGSCPRGVGGGLGGAPPRGAAGSDELRDELRPAGRLRRAPAPVFIAPGSCQWSHLGQQQGSCQKCHPGSRTGHFNGLTRLGSKVSSQHKHVLVCAEVVHDLRHLRIGHTLR
jgi:hypothetical protein